MAQSLAQLYVHIIFSTKNRESFLSDVSIRKEMHAYMAEVIKQQGCNPLIVNGIQDHMHILCKLSKILSLSSFIGETKRVTSKWIKTRNSRLSGSHWQNGYGAFSVSHSKVKKVTSYIAQQEEHHRKVSYKEEFMQFLEKHGVDFDAQYVWD